MRNRGSVPMASEGATTGPSANIPAWHVIFREEYKYPITVFECPAVEGGRLWNGDFQMFVDMDPSWQHPIHYAINAARDRYSRRNDPWQTAVVGGTVKWGSIRGLKDSTQIMSVTEGKDSWVGGGQNGQGLVFRHRKARQINVLFWDGHVDHIAYDQAFNDPTNLLASFYYSNVRPWTQPGD